MLKTDDCHPFQARPCSPPGENRWSLLKIKKVKQTTIFMRGFLNATVEDRLSNGDSGLFDVRFLVSEFNLNNQQGALRAAEANPKVLDKLFPPSHVDEMDLGEAVPKGEMVFRNREVGSNPEQSQVVRSIAGGSSRGFLYLLFGPPGTGKTVTLVEAMTQVRRLRVFVFSVDNDKVRMLMLSSREHPDH